MTSFILTAAICTLLGLLPFFLFSSKPKGTFEKDRRALNLLLLEERQAELKKEDLSEKTLATLMEDTERQALEDLESGQEEIQPQDRRGLWVYGISIVLIPLFSIGAYLAKGHPELLENPPIETAKSNRAMIDNLKQRLLSDPQNLEGWVLLGRSLLATQRAQEASFAFETAARLAPENPDLLAFQAEALAESQNGSLEGSPKQLLLKVLEMNPHHKMGLWLRGLACAQEGDLSGARSQWEQLKKELPNEGPEVAELDQYLSQLGPEPGAESSAKEVSIHLKVSIDPQLLKQTQPDDVVFIFAKLPEGPAMPLAVVRKKVKDLPTEVVLDDSLAMRPGFKLSSQDQVMLGARVSRSGQAIAQSGDLEGFSGPIKPDETKTQEVRIRDHHP